MIACVQRFHKHDTPHGISNMVPPRKKRKVSSAAKKKLASERGEKSASKQGKGVGSRKSFTLPAKWREELYKRGKKTRLQFSSPGKTKYKTQKAVTETLEARDMRDCIHESLSSGMSSEDTKSEESEFLPSCEEDDFELPVKIGEEMERRLFVCESTQLMDMVDQINQTCKCSTSDCNGKLI